MRDARLLKEKFQLSLDNRHVASMAIAALVLLGAAFGLGVVVGRKQAASMPSEAGRSEPLAEVDRKAAFDPAKDLTFQEVLTRPVQPAAKPPPKIEPPRLAEAAPQKSEPEATEPEEAVADTALASAFDRVKAAPEPLARAEAAPGEEFTVQVRASQDKAEADEFAGKLRSSGYRPYIVNAEVPGKGRWYRVRVGRFATKAEAERYLNDFRRETSVEAFVTGAR